MIIFIIINFTVKLQKDNDAFIPAPENKSSDYSFYEPVNPWGDTTPQKYRIPGGELLENSNKCETYRFESLLDNNYVKPNTIELFEDYLDGECHIVESMTQGKDANGNEIYDNDDDEITARYVTVGCSSSNKNAVCTTTTGITLTSGMSISYTERCLNNPDYIGQIGSFNFNYLINNDKSITNIGDLNPNSKCIGISTITVPSDIEQKDYPDLPFYESLGIIKRDETIKIKDKKPFDVVFKNVFCNPNDPRQKLKLNRYTKPYSSDGSCIGMCRDGLYGQITFRGLCAYLDVDFGASGGIDTFSVPTSIGACYGTSNFSFNQNPNLWEGRQYMIYSGGVCSLDNKLQIDSLNSSIDLSYCVLTGSGASGTHPDKNSNVILTKRGSGYTQGGTSYYIIDGDFGSSTNIYSKIDILSTGGQSTRLVFRPYEKDTSKEGIIWIMMPRLDMKKNTVPVQTRGDYITSKWESMDYQCTYGVSITDLDKDTINKYYHGDGVIKGNNLDPTIPRNSFECQKKESTKEDPWPIRSYRYYNKPPVWYDLNTKNWNENSLPNNYKTKKMIELYNKDTPTYSEGDYFCPMNKWWSVNTGSITKDSKKLSDYQKDVIVGSKNNKYIAIYLQEIFNSDFGRTKFVSYNYSTFTNKDLEYFTLLFEPSAGKDKPGEITLPFPLTSKSKGILFNGFLPASPYFSNPSDFIDPYTPDFACTSEIGDILDNYSSKYSWISKPIVNVNMNIITRNIFNTLIPEKNSYTTPSPYCINQSGGWYGQPIMNPKTASTKRGYYSTRPPTFCNGYLGKPFMSNSLKEEGYTSNIDLNNFLDHPESTSVKYPNITYGVNDNAGIGGTAQDEFRNILPYFYQSRNVSRNGLVNPDKDDTGDFLLQDSTLSRTFRNCYNNFTTSYSPKLIYPNYLLKLKNINTKGTLNKLILQPSINSAIEDNNFIFNYSRYGMSTNTSNKTVQEFGLRGSMCTQIKLTDSDGNRIPIIKYEYDTYRLNLYYNSRIGNTENFPIDKQEFTIGEIVTDGVGEFEVTNPFESTFDFPKEYFNYNGSRIRNISGTSLGSTAIGSSVGQVIELNEIINMRDVVPPFSSSDIGFSFPTGTLEKDGTFDGSGLSINFFVTSTLDKVTSEVVPYVSYNITDKGASYSKILDSSGSLITPKWKFNCNNSTGNVITNITPLIIEDENFIFRQEKVSEGPDSGTSFSFSAVVDKVNNQIKDINIINKGYNYTDNSIIEMNQYIGVSLVATSGLSVSVVVEKNPTEYRYDKMAPVSLASTTISTNSIPDNNLFDDRKSLIDTPGVCPQAGFRTSPQQLVYGGEKFMYSNTGGTDKTSQPFINYFYDKLGDDDSVSKEDKILNLFNSDEFKDPETGFTNLINLKSLQYKSQNYQEIIDKYTSSTLENIDPSDNYFQNNLEENESLFLGRFIPYKIIDRCSVNKINEKFQKIINPSFAVVKKDFINYNETQFIEYGTRIGNLEKVPNTFN